MIGLGVLILKAELFCWMVSLIHLEDLTVPHLALVTVLMNWLNLVLEKVVHLVHLSVTSLEMLKAVYQSAQWARERRGDEKG